MPSNPVKIELRDVHKSFGPKQVLRGVDLSVETGQSMVIIGGSGTGKSVTIKLIQGLMKPDKGEILIDGVETSSMNNSKRRQISTKFGMLFQGAALFDSLNVWRNVAFGLIQGRKMESDQAREIALKKLAEVNLGPEVAELMPAELSGGMRKRVGLARAIATDPEVIFFDEPTTGLDPIMSDVINDMIINTVRSIGATAITITHDMASARKIADRIAMLHQGRIIWTDSIDKLDCCATPEVD